MDYLNIDYYENAVLALISQFKNLSFTYPKSLADLYDGLIFYELLNNIDKSMFQLPQNIDLKQIKQDDVVNLLTNMVNQINNYFVSNLSTQLNRNDINIQEIAHHKNQYYILLLFELVLAIAINSEQKAIYLQNIMGLDITYQEVLQQLIAKHIYSQDGQQSERGSLQNLQYDSFIKRNSQNYNNILLKLSEYETENEELKNIINKKNEEYNSLQQKINQLNDIIQNKEDEINKMKQQHQLSLIDLGINSSDDLQELLKIKQLKINQLTENIDQLNFNHNQEKKQLQEELTLVNHKLSTLVKENSQIEFLTEKFNDYNKLKDSYNIQSSDCQKFQKIIEEKDKQIEAIYQKVDQIKEKLNEEKKKNIDLKCELSTKENQIEQLVKNKIDLEIQCKQKEEQNIDLSQIIDKLKQEDPNSSRSQFNSSQKFQATSNLKEDFLQIINEQERENTLLKIELQNKSIMPDTSIDINEEYNKLKQENYLLDQKIINIEKSNLEQKRKHESDLEYLRSQYQVMHDEFQGQIEEQKQTINNCSQENLFLKQQNEQLQLQLDDLKQNSLNKNDVASQYQQEIMMLTSIMQDLVARYKQLQTQNLKNQPQIKITNKQTLKK